MKPLRFRIVSVVESQGLFPGATEPTRSVEVRGVLVDDANLAFRDADFRVRLTPEELKAEGWGHGSVVSLPVETATEEEAAKVATDLASAAIASVKSAAEGK